MSFCCPVFAVLGAYRITIHLQIELFRIYFRLQLAVSDKPMNSYTLDNSCLSNDFRNVIVLVYYNGNFFQINFRSTGTDITSLTTLRLSTLLPACSFEL